MATTLNEDRAHRGITLIQAHPDIDGMDFETAASDTVADVLHARFGVWHPSKSFEAAAFLQHAMTCWVGDAEDEDDRDYSVGDRVRSLDKRDDPAEVCVVAETDVQTKSGPAVKLVDGRYRLIHNLTARPADAIPERRGS